MEKQKRKSKRNAFTALCEYASKNNWCWKLFCTTCGHGSFKIAFSKIISGQHPDRTSFWPNGKDNAALLKKADQYRDFWSESSVANQMKLASIVADAKLSEIKDVAKYPDWLGYIGLVIHHCPSRESREKISESFLPQFISMLKDDKEICDYLQNKQTQKETLSINDLSRIESKSVDLKNPPTPLIFEVL
ncbi:MAG: hypothetical protein FJZ04_00200 [Candidatus Moranbacteria bacterium]|nr:hypothetical protein [Candidatus Moranbacteria bacterium]